MSFEFATCDRRRALEFLQRVYPSRQVTDTEDCAGPMLDLVEQDIIRIQDPMMHGSSPQVSAGTNWKEDAAERSRITSICQTFHDGVMAQAALSEQQP